jgi:aspartate/methionine/tyrosine aminotransferase
MKPIQYIVDWAFPYYRDAKYDLASSGLPEISDAVPEISRDSKYFAMNGLDVIDEAKRKVASLNGVDPSLVTLTFAASGALFMTAFVMAQKRKPVVIESPVYEPIWRDYEALGIEIKWLQRQRKDKYNLKPLIEKARDLTRDSSCLVITNPNNPTGQYDDRDTIAELAEAIKPAYLLVNEAYQPLVENSSTMFGVADNVVTMQTLTKSYAISMPRFGWVLSPPEVAVDLRNATVYIKGNYSSAISAVALPILENLDFVQKRATKHLEGRHAMVEKAIRNHPRISWIAPRHKVILGSLAIDGVTDDLAFCRKLLDEQKVIMAPGTYFLDPGTIRMGMGAYPEKFDEGFEKLLEFAEEY